MTQQAQQGREAGGHSLLFDQMRRWSATEGKGNLAEPLELTVCPSRIGTGQRGKLFRKGLVRALRGKAEKPAHLDAQHHGTLLTGQINQGARVVAMHACRQARTRGTRCGQLPRRQHQQEAILV